MSRRKGEQIEQQVEHFLTQQGLKPLTRNFSAVGGEIDLIMLDRQVLVFIEVRYRNSSQFGNAAESVNWQKQQRISRTAAQYLQQHPKYQNCSCRFDVAACQPDNGGSLSIDWLKQAFDAC